MSSSPITAIVTAYRRIDQTLGTLRRLQACTPPPVEILAHVDGNQRDCERAIREAFPGVRVLLSGENIGPGGGRNKLVAAASHELVASFDDDSFPIDADFFARAADLANRFPDASIIGGNVYHQNEPVAADRREAHWVADYCGGACLFRREAFLAAGGYVPLPVAYGMEEVDLAIRLRAAGGRILLTPWLRVFHDTQLAHHASAEVTAGSIANLALLVYLRYPRLFWPRGLAQLLNRILWLLTHGRSAGVLRGLASIPRVLAENARFRGRVPVSAIRSYFALRRHPVPAAWEIAPD